MISLALTVGLQYTAQADWAVRATRVTGEEIEGNCIALTAEVVTLDTLSGIVIWPRQELLSLDSTEVEESVALPFPITPTESEVPTDSSGLLIFPNDDRLVVSASVPTATSLEIERPLSNTAIRIPWESISFWMQFPHPTSASMIAGVPPRVDRLLLTNGDLISGELTSFDSQGLSIETAAGEIQVTADRVSAVHLNPDLTSLPTLPDTYFICLLTDGSRLTATHCELENDSLQLRLLVGVELTIPVHYLLRIDCYGDHVVSLTTLTIQQWTYMPYLPLVVTLDEDPAATSPLATMRGGLLQRINPGLNRSTLGGPLLLRGSEYARGIGMRSRSSLSFPIKGEFTHFQAVVGIDDRTKGEGSVEFRIESQGTTLWSSPTIAGRDDPMVTGPIDIAGRDELTLIVDFADWGDIHDVAIWGNPILIQNRPSE